MPNYYERRGLCTYKRCSLFDNESQNITPFVPNCVAFIHEGQFYGA